MTPPRTLLAAGEDATARLLVLLALLANLLVHLSPLWVPAVERSGAEICTAHGLVVVPNPGAVPAGQQEHQQRVKFCPFCAVHAAVALASTAALLPFIDAWHAAPLPYERSCVTTARVAGFDRLPRAPPLLS